MEMVDSFSGSLTPFQLPSAAASLSCPRVSFLTLLLKAVTLRLCLHILFTPFPLHPVFLLLPVACPGQCWASVVVLDGWGRHSIQVIQGHLSGVRARTKSSPHSLRLPQQFLHKNVGSSPLPACFLSLFRR